MSNTYVNNIESMISYLLFIIFKYALILITIFTILSLILLIIGCLIKSKTIKLKFLKIVPDLLISLIFLLLLPYLYIKFKNLI